MTKNYGVTEYGIRESLFVGIHDCLEVLLENIEELNIASRKCLYEGYRDNA